MVDKLVTGLTGLFKHRGVEVIGGTARVAPEERRRNPRHRGGWATPAGHEHRPRHQVQAAAPLTSVSPIG